MRATLEKKQRELADAKSRLKEVDEQVAQIKAEYNELVGKKERLRLEAENTATKLERAEKLVSGLAGEKTRWEKAITEYESAAANLPGDCLLASAFLAYCGPFTGDYRSQLKNSWSKKLKASPIPASPELHIVNFLANAAERRDWVVQGLPSDSFSEENAVIVTRTRLWPVMIDPQGQANKWIKNMYKEKGLKIIALNQSDFMRTIENSVQYGAPVLLQDISEDLDPALDPIFNKALVKVGSRLLLRLEEGKEVMHIL